MWARASRSCVPGTASSAHCDTSERYTAELCVILNPGFSRVKDLARIGTAMR
jgi:hypothetical protein